MAVAKLLITPLGLSHTRPLYVIKTKSWDCPEIDVPHTRKISKREIKNENNAINVMFPKAQASRPPLSAVYSLLSFVFIFVRLYYNVWHPRVAPVLSVVLIPLIYFSISFSLVSDSPSSFPPVQNRQPAYEVWASLFTSYFS